MSQTIRLSGIGLLMILFIGCVNQQPEATPSTTTEAAPMISEQLLATAPTNWQIIEQLNTATTRLIDYIPAQETLENWQTRLSFESHAALTDLDPIDTLLREVAKTRERCVDLKDYNLFSGLENNYPTSTRLLLCGQNAFTSRGEVSMLKVIQGNDYFYFIRLVKRVSTFKNSSSDIKGIEDHEIAVWSKYLSNIKVCDSRLTDHSCPVAPNRKKTR